MSKIKYWHKEACICALIMVLPPLLWGNGWEEWIGASAVWTLTRKLSIAQNMSLGDMRCSREYIWHHYAAEAQFAAYFLAVGAHSALVGVGLMMILPALRKKRMAKDHEKNQDKDSDPG